MGCFVFNQYQRKRILESGVRINGIVAISNNGIIGNNGKLVIRNKEDMAHFREFTKGLPVVMGHTTFKDCKRPLYGRFPMVLTHNPTTKYKDAMVFNDLEELTEQITKLRCVVIAGGAQVYKLFDGLYNAMYVTVYDQFANGDTRFPINLYDGKWSRQLMSSITGGTIYTHHYFEKRV